MPELPDLTVVAEQLAARAAGKTVAEATAPTPILLRATPADLDALKGLQLGQARRRGKFLLLPFERDGQPVKLLAANCTCGSSSRMLTVAAAWLPRVARLGLLRARSMVS